MRPDKKNEVRQRMTPAAKNAFLKRFREECSRGIRGGVSEEELAAALGEAVVKEVMES